MAQFETFSAYFSRVLTPEALVFGLVLMALAFFVRTYSSRKLAISTPRFLLIAGSIAGIISLSIRYWDRVGTAEHFWLFDLSLWSSAFTIGANSILNVALYIPAAFLLVLARQSAWKVLLLLTFLSAAIETIQLLTTFGNGDPADFMSNVVGTVLGILLGVVMGRLFPRLVNEGPRPTTSRQSPAKVRGA